MVGIKSLAERMGLVATLPQDDEEAIEILKKDIEVEQMFKTLTAQQCWKLFEGVLQGKKEEMILDLRTCGADGLEKTQAALNTIDDVLKIAPEAIARGAAARKELEQHGRTD